MVTDWPGNYVVPSEHVPFQLSVPDYRTPDDVTMVVVTRFWVADGHPSEGILGRRQLLERYTLPSLLRQTYVPDVWLVLVSEWALEEAAQLNWPGFARLVPMRPRGEELSSLTSGIRLGLEDVTLRKRVIVSRCDGDDALATDYCEGLVKWACASRQSGPAWLHYPIGVQHDARTGEARVDIRTEGHFNALLQPSSQRIIGPYAVPHTEVYKDRTYPVRQLITRQPMWCEVVHRYNAINRMRQAPELAPGWKARFGW